MTVVYFIQCQRTGRIKIGASSKPKKRMADMQVGSPTKLRLIGTTDEYGEKELHRRFVTCRLHGEWYRPTPELISLIADITDHDFSHDPSLEQSNRRLGMIRHWGDILFAHDNQRLLDSLRSSLEELQEGASELVGGCRALFSTHKGGYRNTVYPEPHNSRSLVKDMGEAADLVWRAAHELSDRQFARFGTIGNPGHRQIMWSDFTRTEPREWRFDHGSGWRA